MSQIISSCFASFLSPTVFKGIAIHASSSSPGDVEFSKESSSGFGFCQTLFTGGFTQLQNLPWPSGHTEHPVWWPGCGSGVSSIRQLELQAGCNPKEAVGFLGMWARVCCPYPHPVTVNCAAGFGRKCFFSSAGSGSCLQEFRSALLLWPVSIRVTSLGSFSFLPWLYLISMYQMREKQSSLSANIAWGMQRCVRKWGDTCG